jgi:high-affinity iron transporter
MTSDRQVFVAGTVTPVHLGLPERAVGPWVKRFCWAGVFAAAAVVIAILFWQGVTSAGNPDPTVKGISPAAAIVDTGVLVFREGLEAILVLAALTASLARTEEGYWKPVAVGAGVSFLATIVTWFVVVGVITDLAINNARALDVQAATGLLAIVVLLVIMNWFFHRIYWTGWITHHNRKKQSLIRDGERTRLAMWRGLAIIGFTSVYREGFEIVLFLQSMRLQVGSHVILLGVCCGVVLTLTVAMLTFVAHYRLPYKRMLVLTGIMIGIVLLVMVGEQVQEMQQANWISTTNINVHIPDWMGVWFSIFPNWETVGAQAVSATFVIGSYFLARRVCRKKVPKGVEVECIVPDCGNCMRDSKLEAGN